MNGIKFQATYKGKISNVRVSRPNGGGGSSFQIEIDNYYIGSVAEYTTGWTVVPQRDDSLNDQQKEGILRRLREAGLIDE